MAAASGAGAGSGGGGVTPLVDDVDPRLAEMSAAELAAAIAAGEVTAVDVVQSALAAARRAMIRPPYAIASLDMGRALTAARAADAKTKRIKATGRGRLGALHGVPVVIKDNINVDGMPTTAGTDALLGYVPTEDAPVVTALRDSGAIVIAHTVMSEMGVAVTGFHEARDPVTCAYHAARIAGGSSSGTAAAVAARVVPIGLGTDMCGGVRIPAAFNGVCGLRPTTGRYSTAAVLPYSRTRDSVGVIARTVADLELLDSVLAPTGITGGEAGAGGSRGGGDHDDVSHDSSRSEAARRAEEERARDSSPASVAGLRFGVPTDATADVELEVGQAFDAVCAKLTAAGAEVVSIDVSEADALAAEASSLTRYEASQDVAAFLHDYGTRVSMVEILTKAANDDCKRVFGFKMGDKAATKQAYDHAITVLRPRLGEACAALFAGGESGAKVVAILRPTTPMPAGAGPSKATHGKVQLYLHDHAVPSEILTRNLTLGSVAGLPGVTLPCAMAAPTDDRKRHRVPIPIGVALDGAVGSDRRLLRIAAAVEAVVGRLPPPDPPAPP